MKKTLAFFLALLCLLTIHSPGMAGYFQGDGHQVIVNGEVTVRLQKLEEWTVVTPENMQEHMALLTARGDGEDAVKWRFANANIELEAYHPKLPRGRVRMQVFEDEQSRSVWNLEELTKGQMADLKKELEESLFQGYLHLFNVKYDGTAPKQNRDFHGSMIAYPPSAYESGIFCLRYFNGKAYLLSYTENTQASSKKILAGDSTYDRIQSWTDVVAYHPKLVGEKLTAVADLRTDTSRLILNAHSGDFLFTGITEKDARVTLRVGERDFPAAVDGEGAYGGTVTLAPGLNTVVAAAEKSGLSANTLSRVISANDAMAALELTAYPMGSVDRANMRVAGVTAPGGTVTVKIDEEAPMQAEVKEDGSFSCPVTAEDWVEHTIEITAAYPGLENCTAKFSFEPGYEDAAKGIAAYKKTLTSGVTGKKISAGPDAYVGSRVKMEVYTTQVERTDGRLILTARIDKDKNRPILLVCPDYMEDAILDQMILTVYGTVIEPSRTEAPIPRLDVDYIQYRKVVYRRRAY